MAAYSSCYGQLQMGSAAIAAPQSSAYIGACMNLLTHTEVRYQGLCIHLDFQNGTVVLTYVKNFGSEGRRTDVQIPPSETDSDTILFRRSDIKEIQVLSLPNNPSIATLPDHPLVLEADQTHPSSTSPQVANITSEISSRLSALFQGIPKSTQSLWSSGFWASLYAYLAANRDSFGMPTFSPGLVRPSPSVGIISRPQRPSLPLQSPGLAVSRAPIITTVEAVNLPAIISKCSSVTSSVPLVSVAPFNCPAVQQDMPVSVVPLNCPSGQQNTLNPNVSPIMPYDAQTATLNCSSPMLPNSLTSYLILNDVLPPVVEKEQSTDGLTISELDLSVTLTSESESVPEDWETAHDLQQQSEKDGDCDSLSGDTKVSAQLPEDTKKFSTHQRHQNGRGSQGSHRSVGARGSYRGRGSTGNAARGRGRMKWAIVP